MTVVSLSCHLSPLFIFLSPFYAFSPVYKTSPLLSSHQLSLPSYFSCQISPPFSLLWHFFSCLQPPSLTLLSPLLPQDPKERLGCHPQTGFADIMGHPFFRNVDWDLVSHSLFILLVFCSAFLTTLINFILTFIIISNGEENHYSQVKINLCIDSVWREKRKT